MKAYHIDRANAGLLLIPNYNNQAAGSMRKYQQVALALISIVSLIAFLFYKHEYDRLHYTFEYLETFGTVGDENNMNFCGNKVLRKLNTAPAFWQKLTPEFAVYSTFWDVKSSTLLALVLYRSKHNVNVSINSESQSTVTTMGCALNIEQLTVDKNFGLMTCSSTSQLKKPFLARYTVAKEVRSRSVYVQRSETWRSVINASCICIFSTSDFVPTQKIVEFIAYHNGIGIEKFVFYGYLLTPTLRRILDMNGDEWGIFYEEKQFNVPEEFILTADQYRKLVEIDCSMRHKNFYENVIALQPNEYMIIKGKPTLNAVIASMPISQTKISSLIFKLNLKVQNACYKLEDVNKPYVSLDLKILRGPHDDQVSLIRPHLMFGGQFNQSLDTEQHIPKSSLSIYNFLPCSSVKVSQYEPFSMNNAYLSLIERSLLYRKWEIYD